MRRPLQPAPPQGSFILRRDKIMTIKGYFEQPSFCLAEVPEEKQCN